MTRLPGDVDLALLPLFLGWSKARFRELETQRTKIGHWGPAHFSLAQRGPNPKLWTPLASWSFAGHRSLPLATSWGVAALLYPGLKEGSRGVWGAGLCFSP